MLIRSTRRSQHLSQEQLAGRLDVSRAWIVQIEQGKPSVRLDLVMRVMNELGITLSASNDETEKMPQPDAVDDDDIFDIDSIADMGLQDKKRSGGKSRAKRRR